MSNHQSYIDIWIIPKFAITVFVAKAEVKQMPLVGWGASAVDTDILIETIRIVGQPQKRNSRTHPERSFSDHSRKEPQEMVMAFYR